MAPFFRKREQQDEQPAPKAAELEPAPRALGASGTVNLKGFLQQQEYLYELTGLNGIRTYDRMRKSDASVREALEHIFAPVMNADWTIEPASEDDPLDLEVAAFVREAYFEWPVTPWLKHLREELKYLVFGHYLFETVMMPVHKTVRWTDGEGNDGEVERAYVTLRRFAPRLPETIFRWNVREGELQSVQQSVMDDDGQLVEPTIPAELLLVQVADQEGDDFNGQSILRTAYKPWIMKELVEKVSAIAAERHGAGIPVVYLPRSSDGDPEIADKAEAMLQGMRAGEFSYLVWPGPKSTGQMDGYTFEIAAPSGTLPDLVPLMEYHRAEIKASVLARFSELGHGGTGARATSDSQSEVWYDALHAIANAVCASHEVFIRRLVDMNYQVDRYPKLTVSDIESKNLAEFAESVSKLVGSGAMIADPNAREWVRMTVDAPPENEPEEIVADQEDRGGLTEQQQLEAEQEGADADRDLAREGFGAKAKAKGKDAPGDEKKKASDDPDVIALTEQLDVLRYDLGLEIEELRARLTEG